MKEPVFTGVCTALITPFDKQNNIDLSMLERLIDRQLRAGVGAIAVCTAAGEASVLTREERSRIVAHTVRYVSGRCRIIAGIGAVNTAVSAELARDAQFRGADTLLAVPPDDGWTAHCEAVAAAVDLPIIVSVTPYSACKPATAEACAALCRIKSVHGVAAGGDPVLVSRARNLCRDGLYIWSVRDDAAVSMMAAGAHGLISVTANLTPRKIVRMIRACQRGNYLKAGDMQAAFLPLIDAMHGEKSPCAVKDALKKAGFNVGPCRSARGEPSGEYREVLTNLLEKVHIDP